MPDESEDAVPPWPVVSEQDEASGVRIIYLDEGWNSLNDRWRARARAAAVSLPDEERKRRLKILARALRKNAKGK